jgi:hypothetical protein
MNLRQKLIDAVEKEIKANEISRYAGLVSSDAVWYENNRLYDLRSILMTLGTLFGVEIPEQVPDAEPLREWLGRWPGVEKYTDPDTIAGHALIAIRSALGEKGGV